MMNHSLGVARLLRMAGESDQAAFAALYDATAPAVYGLAATTFADPDNAAAAVRVAFQNVWEQAPHFNFGYGAEAWDEPARNRTVYTWVLTLSQQTFSDLVRNEELTGSAAPETVITAVDDLPELAPLTPAQRAALALGWAGTGTYRQVAQVLGVSIPTLKSRLRDAVQRLTLHYRRQLQQEPTEADPVLTHMITPEVVAQTGIATSFSEQVDQDIQHGLAQELAALETLGLLEEPEHILIEAHMASHGPEQVGAWRQRVALSQRTVVWAMRGMAEEPPSGLLQQVLAGLPEQNLGIGLMSGLHDDAPSDEPAPSRAPARQKNRRWVVLIVVVLVVVAAVWAVARLFVGLDAVAVVDRAEDVVVTEPVSMAHGGQVSGHLSADENLAYLSFTEVPRLSETEAYQVWVYSQQGGSASSVGLYTAEELEDQQVRFRDVTDFVELWITVEPAQGSESPTSEVLATLDLEH